jgi:hypothetical protein
MPTNEHNELPLPMLAFKLEGMDDSIELTIDEVWGYPNETSYGGGYGAKGNLSIRAGEYMVVNAFCRVVCLNIRLPTQHYGKINRQEYRLCRSRQHNYSIAPEGIRPFPRLWRRVCCNAL